MRSCGIIVEYNPFHNGHAYHAQKARKISGAEVVIAVMSGNFLQRGEPAIMDKWQRAEVALQNGVDLVVELPFAWAVQSADYFAKGGVRLLQALQCDALCFGTDDETAFDYQDYGNFFKTNQALIDQKFQMLPTGLSYPEKMAAVIRELYPQSEQFPPNHILGLSYAKENADYPRPMELFPVKRKDSGYHETLLQPQKFASATGIRTAFFAGETWQTFVPQQTVKLLQHGIDWTDFWPYLQYQLTVDSLARLPQLYQMKEGLEHRLKQAASAESFSAWLQQVKTKRYTKPRLQRLALYTLLQISADEIKREQEQTLLHVLGFTKAGQRFLKQERKNFTLPLAAKMGQAESQQHFLTTRADQVYQLVTGVEQNFGRIPLRF